MDSILNNMPSITMALGILAVTVLLRSIGTSFIAERAYIEQRYRENLAEEAAEEERLSDVNELLSRMRSEFELLEDRLEHVSNFFNENRYLLGRSPYDLNNIHIYLENNLETHMTNFQSQIVSLREICERENIPVLSTIDDLSFNVDFNAENIMLLKSNLMDLLLESYPLLFS